MKLISAVLDPDDGCDIVGVARVEMTEHEIRALDMDIRHHIESGVTIGTAMELVAKHKEYMAILEAINRLRR